MSTVNYDDSINELKRMFTFLNERISQNTLPEPIFNIVDKGNRRTFVWFKSDIWNSGKEKVPGFFFSKEALQQCSSYDLVNLMVKLMVNLKNHQKGIKDVSIENYFNKNFKNQAEEYGLIVEMTKYNGYEETKLDSDLVKLTDELKVDKSVLDVKKVRKKVIVHNKYDSISVNEETKKVLKTFCTLTGMSMIEVTNRALLKFMEDYKK